MDVRSVAYDGPRIPQSDGNQIQSRMTGTASGHSSEPQNGFAELASPGLNLTHSKVEALVFVHAADNNSVKTARPHESTIGLAHFLLYSPAAHDVSHP